MRSRHRIELPKFHPAPGLGEQTKAAMPGLASAQPLQQQQHSRTDMSRFLEGISVTDDDRLLTFDDFRSALCVELKLELGEVEMLRVWEMLILPEGQPQSPEAIREQTIKFETFVARVCESEFMQVIAKRLDAAEYGGFPVDEAYAWDKSTNENYSVTADAQTFVGKYAELRRGLDYSYHARYSERRQAWQDHAIDLVVQGRAKQASPWVVYTCGPMGVGKGHALRWMSDAGYFPLDGIVCIDPDHFKSVMPEWDGYVARDRDSGTSSAGDMCHRESGFLQEIAQEIAMRNSQNVWVDGSLRDGGWFAKVLCDLRRRHPHYQFAIFEVSASERTIRERIASRAKRTGRAIPEHLIQASLASVATSLEKLTPLVDFVARIGNDGPTPHLRAYLRVDASGDWGVVRAQFAREGRASSFPDSLAPLLLTPLSSPELTLRPLPPATGVSAAGALARLSLDLSHPGLDRMRLALLASATGDARLPLLLSPERPVTYDRLRRTAAGIPLAAVSFAFVHPAPIERAQLPQGVDLTETAEGKLALLGGFCYFDESHAICGVNAVQDLQPDADADGFATGNGNSQYSGISARLEFAAPQWLRPDALDSIAASRRRPVKLTALRSKGAREFVFVVAGEQLAMLDGSMQVFPKGGFAYLLDFETSAPDATWQTVTRTGTMSGRVLCFPVAD